MAGEFFIINMRLKYIKWSQNINDEVIGVKKKEEKPKQGVGRLFELAGEKKGKLTFACGCAVLSSAMRIVCFFTIYGVIREVLTACQEQKTADLQNIFVYGMVTLAGVIGYGIFAYVSSAVAHTAAYDLLYEIRIRLMEKMSRISAGYFTNVTQGAIKKVMSDDVEELEGFVAHSLCEVSAAIATPVFTVAYLFFMDWKLALVTLLPILLSFLLLGMCLKQKEKAAMQKEMHDNLERMTGTIVEYIHGMPVVKVFHRSLGAFRRYETDIDRFVGSVEKTAKSNAAPMGLYYVTFGAQLLFLLPACIFKITHADSYIDGILVVILFLLIGQGLKEPLENMMTMTVMLNRVTESVSRVDQILNQPEIISNGTREPKRFDVSFENVTFSYQKDIPVIKNVSLKVPEGSVNGIVGPSGSGKSTLMELLLRFYDVDGGTIRIGGEDIREIPIERLMDLIAYVFQDSVLFHDTIENNIRMGNKKASFEEVCEAAKNAGIHEVILNLKDGYQTVVGAEHTYLSGGEIQRLAIARLFLKDAPIIVMDEATAYADAENEAKIQQAFARLAQKKTVFIIAHRLKTIQNADCIFVMNEGRVEAGGTHEKLLASCALYRDMVAANERRDQWTIENGKGGSLACAE